MIHQLLAGGTRSNPLETNGTAKDPRNPQAVTILALPVLPLAWSALNEPDPMRMIYLVAALSVFAASFAAILKGLANKDRYEAAQSAKKPLPFKIFGCLGIGLGVAAVAVIKEASIVQTAQYGIIAAALALASFGLDPLRDKKLDTVESRALHQMRDVRAALLARLDMMQNEIDTLGREDLTEHLSDLEVAVVLLCDAACDDPMRARSLRRHFGPIFDGIEQATQRFTKRYRIDPDADALDMFTGLLCEVEDNYYERARAFVREGSSELDVQSDVLGYMMKRA